MKQLHSHYIELLCACYNDIASAYPAQYEVEHQRDIAYIRRRYADEGMTFLTKSLPSLAKALDKALATDTPLAVLGFRKKPKSNLPSFLGWLIGRVLSIEGIELDDSDPIALVQLRQLLYLFYKLEMPYADSDVSRVIEEFKSTDSGLRNPWNYSEPAHINELIYASSIIARVVSGTDPRDIIPRHGPGSVATGEKLDGKAYFRRDYKQLTSIYPLDAFYYLNVCHMESCLTNDGLQVRDSKGSLRPWIDMDYSTAKVVLVPKDSRGPRLISMEPLEVQWIQQGQCACLVKQIESHWLTKNQVNFTLQSINRYLAWWSSHGSVEAPKSRVPSEFSSLPPGVSHLREELVTLDMKEASDRVSVRHIQALFPEIWTQCLLASRSSHTELPNGEVIPLNKFAPMGSAVCFPVEALIFWALSVSALHTIYPHLSLSSLRKRVWVYGDDIICHKTDYLVIMQSLQRSGLLLNENKCCTGRFFRESCGMDAYKGTIVTPLRIKQCYPDDAHWTGQQVMAYVSYSNDAYRRGYTNLAISLEKLLSDSVPIPFTTVDRGAAQFVRPDLDVRILNRKARIRTRFDKQLHIPQAYGPTPRAAIKGNRPVTRETYFVSSLELLSKPGTTECSLPKAKGTKLEPDQYSIPRRVTSKRGWTQFTI